MPFTQQYGGVQPIGLLGCLLIGLAVATAVVTWTPHGVAELLSLHLGFADVATGLGLTATILCFSVAGGVFLSRGIDASWANQTVRFGLRVTTPIITVVSVSAYLAVYSPYVVTVYGFAVCISIIAGIANGILV